VVGGRAASNITAVTAVSCTASASVYARNAVTVRANSTNLLYFRLRISASLQAAGAIR
jgi:hypothetical protein